MGAHLARHVTTPRARLSEWEREGPRRRWRREDDQPARNKMEASGHCAAISPRRSSVRREEAPRRRRTSSPPEDRRRGGGKEERRGGSGEDRGRIGGEGECGSVASTRTSHVTDASHSPRLWVVELGVTDVRDTDFRCASVKD
ncbi:hypothetical protein EYF80_053878 [Liparis tanakae]|uniref:Uncharacterized protein n=1 Tax=Liparis tanakae TaxID=230148 RepID=A0A4Z2F5E2_9TELE|nr:hypothetical protein EYF80_053878 [Liparis tanakae]